MRDLLHRLDVAELLEARVAGRALRRLRRDPVERAAGEDRCRVRELEWLWSRSQRRLRGERRRHEDSGRLGLDAARPEAAAAGEPRTRPRSRSRPACSSGGMRDGGRAVAAGRRPRPARSAWIALTATARPAAREDRRRQRLEPRPRARAQDAARLGARRIGAEGLDSTALRHHRRPAAIPHPAMPVILRRNSANVVRSRLARSSRRLLRKSASLAYIRAISHAGLKP